MAAAAEVVETCGGINGMTIFGAGADERTAGPGFAKSVHD
jgi:hypothetical protein